MSSLMMTKFDPYLISRKRLLLLCRILLFSLIFFTIVLYVVHFFGPSQLTSQQRAQQIATTTTTTRNEELFLIAMTICGNKSFYQGMISLKSVLIFSSHKKVHLVLMTDEYLMEPIRMGLDQMNSEGRGNASISYEFHPIQYPESTLNWRMLFKECASQRLFLPNILANYDSILYIDTDVLLLSPINEIWSFFSKMNASQMSAMTYESEDFSSNWYHRFARHPFYKPFGLNSGVMLMNLTRMREFNWNSRLEAILEEYKTKIVWGDQDIINIIFSKVPHKLYRLDCNWNYRPDHCTYSLTCKEAIKNGIKLLHGNRGSFITDKQPSFRLVFHSLAQYDLRRHNLDHLHNIIQSSVDMHSRQINCYKSLDYILKSINMLPQAS